MPSLIWSPSPERIAASRLSEYGAFVAAQGGQASDDYKDLHAWSVENPAAFWQSVWDFTNIRSSVRAETVLKDGHRFPGAQWFPGARLNYAENLLAGGESGPAIIGYLETGARSELSWPELKQGVARIAEALTASGVEPGDRVAGMMPNVPETLVAMLATASIGAVWSSCSPDFGVNGVLDRFGQIDPKVLFVCDGYHYGGKVFDCTAKVEQIAERLDSLLAVVSIQLLEEIPLPKKGVTPWMAFGAEEHQDAAALKPAYRQLPFDHPLFIMYSSGTTGAPKCIVHGAGGTLIQHLKEHQLHVGLRPGDRLFYATTCGWMMWNWMASALASGVTLVLYDGSPFHPGPETFFNMVDQEQIKVLGVGAKYISSIEKAGLKPSQSHNLSALRTILSTGSPLSHEGFQYVYRDVKADLCLSSISGGTDIISCFVLGNECLPVYEGEIQCMGLGMSMAIWDEDGQPVSEVRGELVCDRPFPSAPIGFWNDPEGERYHSSYFATYLGVWAHGDYAELTAQRGMIIHGRSDAVLNPGGVRIGTAEIYRQVESFDEVVEAVCVGQDWGDDTRVILFVILREGEALNEALTHRIRQKIRDETTPRHVPAQMLAVTDIPRTRSGKIAEVAVRDVINGKTPKSTEGLSNPESLDEYRDMPALKSA
ncbi:MAG: acetoacetate--CoA ligase [Luminiphilus sp.]|jgi:acetoacetyl-CoA synthetase|nr:acetoacetate--CoA ligase [Luminiphilus sp.]